MNDKKETRQRILGELESIKSLLDGDEASDDPPLLTEVLDVAQLSEDLEHNRVSGTRSPEQEQEPRGDRAGADDDDGSTPQEGTGEAQPELFEPSTESPRPASGENPFLPPHIRQRLGDQSPPPPREDRHSREDALVEELVRRHLPRLERELRRKIRAMIRARRNRHS